MKNVVRENEGERSTSKSVVPKEELQNGTTDLKAHHGRVISIDAELIRKLSVGTVDIYERFVPVPRKIEARKGYVEQCCCEIPLRTGCMLIGILSLPLPILEALMIPYRYFLGPSWETFDDGADKCPVAWREVGFASTYVLNLHWALAAIHVLCMCALIGLAVTLIVGTYQKNVACIGAAKSGAALVLWPFLIYFVVEWGVSRLYRVNLFITAFLLLSPALWIYCLLVIDAYHQQLMRQTPPNRQVMV
ncbi:hypothetical protein GE061_010404 [Apolygus lucorum]|uniref:Uncharacterized protein n=1 Tax=Apolygus lucorum TaxID=248454 RepID=A0A6A4IQQ2_APOLU|nr:hypothetical protein GE061_010404 [Apolygus lucorum]